AFDAVEHSPVPVRLAADGRRGSNLEVAADAGGIDDPSVAGLAHIESALAMAVLVVIAVSEERTQLQRAPGAAHQPVGDDRPPNALLHPDPFLDSAGCDVPAEHRERAIEFHALQLAIAPGKDRAIPVLLGREG